MEARSQPLTIEAAEPSVYYPGHEGKEYLAYTVHTRDYRAYAVASDCLADAIAAFCADGGR